MQSFGPRGSPPFGRASALGAPRCPDPETDGRPAAPAAARAHARLHSPDRATCPTCAARLALSEDPLPRGNTHTGRRVTRAITRRQLPGIVGGQLELFLLRNLSTCPPRFYPAEWGVVLGLLQWRACWSPLPSRGGVGGSRGGDGGPLSINRWVLTRHRRSSSTPTSPMLLFIALRMKARRAAACIRPRATSPGLLARGP